MPILQAKRYKMKTYENVKCDVNVRSKIKKPRLLPATLHGVDLTICKLCKRPIIFAIVKYCVKTGNLNDKILNSSEVTLSR